MLLAILAFVVIIGILIFVHEAGHFLVARRAGIAVSEFGFGFPPRIAGVQRVHGKWRVVRGNVPVDDNAPTIYSINLIPLGGFVRIKGESGDRADEPDSFGAKPRWVRALVLVAGVAMNLLLAAALFSAVFAIGAPQVLDGIPDGAHVRNREVKIVAVVAGSPAAIVGLLPNDTIVAMDGHTFTVLTDVQAYIRAHGDTDVAITIARDGASRIIAVHPVMLKDAGRPGIGVQLLETGIVSFSVPAAIVQGMRTTGAVMWDILKNLGGLVRGLVVERRVSVDVAGPVGIAVMTGQVVKLGFVYLIQFAAVLSANLALLNVFPFPALDGGRLFLLLVEAIRRKPLSQGIERTVHAVGYGVLLLLVLVVTYHDLATFGGGILKAIRTTVGF